ncbi:hypothetical protein [Bradyrhizobium sp. 2S1]|uniref:hypothetical protein n=1 Tax=Bradyrhizobium sp. 2S1 TaxID=1404429 RepID=UPI00140C05F9|nr:hypothetical protein [Bradyrhizobium sp. 2S1]MCK7673451.1 hypothetical protein [Bradyrhizobium sp. 2S1]
MNMKEARLWADPETAARRIMEHARAFEPIQDGRIYIERINYPFIDKDGASPAEYTAGLNYAIEHDWLEKHESGTYVKMLQAGNDLFTREPPSVIRPAILTP